MACGAIVVGYDGFGGREYILPDFAFPVPAGDLLEFARTLERVVTLQMENPECVALTAPDRLQASSRDVLARARREGTRRGVG